MIIINEFLPKPRYDWIGDGKFSTGDEFIELIYAGTVSVNIERWLLGDIAENATLYEIPNKTLDPGELLVIFRSESGIGLSDSGDAIYLYQPDRSLVDERAYNYAKDMNISWCRIPDGEAELAYPCWPTPGENNTGYPLEESIKLPEIPEFSSPTDLALPEIMPGYLIPNGLRLCGFK